MGTREPITAPHSFTDWWDRFGTSHPDWFAVPPNSDYTQPWPQPSRVKLRISHPEVADQILADWREAGRPSTWSVTPNDSTGFDTSPESMAMDYPADQDPVAVWLGRTTLAPRFVKFWNGLLERMRTERPDVMLLSLAYAAYAEAPPAAAGVTVTDGVVLGVVPAPWHQHDWQAWSDLGAHLYLRPNWWHSGASAPLLPLQFEGGFVEFAREHNSAGFDFDSVMGYWGNQHLRYYLTARLHARPDLSVADVIAEYLACFGTAASAVADYIAYWEDFTTRASYPIGYPNLEVQDPDGLFSRAIREHGITQGATKGSVEALAHLFPDSVVQPARDILAEARHLAGGDADVLARISFLEDGMAELVAVRDTLVLGKPGPDERGVPHPGRAPARPAQGADRASRHLRRGRLLAGAGVRPADLLTDPGRARVTGPGPVRQAVTAPVSTARRDRPTDRQRWGRLDRPTSTARPRPRPRAARS